MPPVPHLILASGAAAAAFSVAIAAAIAIYESPEVWRYTEDFRRRIALALESMGNGFNVPDQEPRFNRPEDADGFVESTGSPAGADPGVDADEESRRRQREELLYWNAVRLRNLEKSSAEQEKSMAGPQRPNTGQRGSSFDDFLKQDESAEQGTFVFNSGADVQNDRDGLRRRGAEALRGLSATLYANPFADENHIGNDELEEMLSSSNVAPGRDEISSDIYSATTRDPEERQAAPLDPSAMLIDLGPPSTPAETESSRTETSATLDRQLADDEYMVAGQEDRQEAYASIQAWAHDSSRNFYSPLPVTPAEPVSEPELISDGEFTPTDSMSLEGSGEDVANDALSSREDEHGRLYDVMSESEGIPTPGSWSEVGSVISESDAPVPPMHS